MRGAGFVLLAAIALAGCADAPSQGPAIDPNANVEHSEPAPLPRAEVDWQLRQLLFVEVALTGASSHEFSITVPAETRSVLANFTLGSGVTSDPWIDVDGQCSKSWPGTFAPDGEVVPAWCGDRLRQGDHAVQIGHKNGRLEGVVEVTAWVCPSGAQCTYWPRAE